MTFQDHVTSITGKIEAAMAAKSEGEVIKDRPHMNLLNHMEEALRAAVASEDLSEHFE
jgi:hypothetical protein